jgi:hypothetical protein
VVDVHAQVREQPPQQRRRDRIAHHHLPAEKARPAQSISHTPREASAATTSQVSSKQQAKRTQTAEQRPYMTLPRMTDQRGRQARDAGKEAHGKEERRRETKNRDTQTDRWSRFSTARRMISAMAGTAHRTHKEVKQGTDQRGRGCK